MNIENETIRSHRFLAEMSADRYFPSDLVEEGKQILLRLCESIERDKPDDATSLLALTHEATERFNDLAEKFSERGSEIETAARDDIGSDFEFILRTYGFDTDVEDAIAPRDW